MKYFIELGELNLYKSPRSAKKALKLFLRKATKGYFSANDCAYCYCDIFRLVNITNSEIIEQIMPQEPVYKIPPKGAKDLKIVEQHGKPGGWIAGIGPHDVICSKCNAFIEHREFFYLQHYVLRGSDK